LYRVACAGASPAQQPRQLKPLDGGGCSMADRSMVRGRGGVAGGIGNFAAPAPAQRFSESFGESGQVIRENPASRGTETSAEVLVVWRKWVI